MSDSRTNEGNFDIIVIGAGIAGAGISWELARTARVALVEREDQPGYHTTGRSAAVYLKGYGTEVIRDLTLLSEAFLAGPPADFSEAPLIRPRGALTLVRPDQMARLDQFLALQRRHVPHIEQLEPKAFLAMVPALDPAYAAAAVYDGDARDLDVDAIFQGFLRGFRQRGGKLFTSAEILTLGRADGLWHVGTPRGTLHAPVVVNASGAWADRLAGLAGLAPLGMVPKRRTALIVRPPDGLDVNGWPCVDDIDEQFYFRPEAGKLLCSPADKTPSEPCDAQPEELDIAIAIDRIEKALPLGIRRVERSWAGLRTFVADGSPVVGFDPRTEGFFWLAGQGGYGIQTSPALSHLAARLATRHELSETEREIAAALRPERLLG
ncbi:MAG: FAD-binding oxidoreductase [Geminicoccaceae bacterium]